MPRGLSNLQQFILRRADELNCVYQCDILETFFKWTPVRPIRRYDGTAWAVGQTGQVISPDGRYFSRRGIGETEYAKTLTTLKRSCQRLTDRGLVSIRREGIPGWTRIIVFITDRGRAWLADNTTTLLR